MLDTVHRVGMEDLFHLVFSEVVPKQVGASRRIVSAAGTLVPRE